VGFNERGKKTLEGLLEDTEGENKKQSTRRNTLNQEEKGPVGKKNGTCLKKGHWSKKEAVKESNLRGAKGILSAAGGKKRSRKLNISQSLRQEGLWYPNWNEMGTCRHGAKKGKAENGGAGEDSGRNRGKR